MHTPDSGQAPWSNMGNPFNSLAPRYKLLYSKPQSTSCHLPNPLILVFMFIVAITSFFVGRRTAPSDSLLTIPLKSTARIFHYDSLFGSPPSNSTNAAWHSLFPSQGGFFKHPDLAPTRSAFAVFHQLHCLNSLRQTHHLLLSILSSPSHTFNASSIPPMNSAPHVRHCIDLIRQSLMCRPDTTVEVKNEERGGVTGFGTEHICWDWDGLVKWTGDWEAWGDEGAIEKVAMD